MQALLKSYQFGIDCGPNFMLSSEGVNINPSTVTKSQLFNGIVISFDQNIDFVRVSSTGKCNGAYYDVLINKDCQFDLPENLLATEVNELFQTENEQFIEVFIKQ
jgi:hypothetical protein